MARAAAALRRLWRAAPQRALGRPHGSHARTPLPAGRRTHLLHRRPDTRRDQRVPGVPRPRLQGVRLHFQPLPVHAARKVLGRLGGLEQGRRGTYSYATSVREDGN